MKGVPSYKEGIALLSNVIQAIVIRLGGVLENSRIILYSFIRWNRGK